jgi:hypothetical protein
MLFFNFYQRLILVYFVLDAGKEVLSVLFIPQYSVLNYLKPRRV